MSTSADCLLCLSIPNSSDAVNLFESLSPGMRAEFDGFKTQWRNVGTCEDYEVCVPYKYENTHAVHI